MKYKITAIQKKPQTSAAKESKRKRRIAPLNKDKLLIQRVSALPDYTAKKFSLEDFSNVFGFGGFYEELPEDSAIKTGRFRAFAFKFRMQVQRVRETFVSKIRLARERRLAKRRQHSSLPILCGALCALMCVCVVSVGAALYRLLFWDRLMKLERVTVPLLVGTQYTSDALDSELFEVVVYQVYDADTPQGTVIEQSPLGGVKRRVQRGEEPCRITLTVSLGERYLVMKDYTSRSLRDTLLELKNEAVKFKISEQYSDTVAQGEVISTAPAAGERFSAEDVVSLVVSRGAQTKYIALPELCGLTEVRASEILRALGLEVGDISYVTSDAPSGTVISQSPSAYSMLQLGARVDMTVSAGFGFAHKTIPNLYGLTLAEARERLAEVGLVCGRVYNVNSGAKKMTIVSQSVAAGTPITSGIASVDVYVSS